MVATHPERGMPETPPSPRRRRRRLAGLAGRAIGLAAVPFAIATALLAFEDTFELGNGIIGAGLAFMCLAVVAMLLVGLRELRAAEARTGAAIARATNAESMQRSRADELASVLKASESLAFSGEGRVDYLAVLEAITPDGATSFLVRVESETEGAIVAAHGPAAASTIGTRRSFPPTGTESGRAAAPIASFSRSGHAIGAEMPREHMAGFDLEVEAALAIRLADHGGRALGWLHLLDHQDERILEPSFVNLAQLMANQIAVAMENNALLVRMRRQLVEVQRVQEQLIQASKLGAVGELAAAVAHEVNNPLTGILGFAELLMAELPEDDPRHGEAEVIRDEAVRSRSIIRALLEFARPRPPQRIPTNIDDLARATIDLIRFRASEGDIRIVATYGDLPCLEIDADAFRQVLLNLFNNAVDAMPQGGELRVTTLAETERVGVVIADVGVGMDEVTRERIFTPFFSTRAGSGGGTGLGLSVSLQIVESHGGTIDVDSAPGRGSVFTVWLPRSSPAFEGDILVSGTELRLPAQPSTELDSGACEHETGLAPKNQHRKVAA
jgi:signal transduction histidine kinase